MIQILLIIVRSLAAVVIPVVAAYKLLSYELNSTYQYNNQYDDKQYNNADSAEYSEEHIQQLSIPFAIFSTAITSIVVTELVRSTHACIWQYVAARVYELEVRRILGLKRRLDIVRLACYHIGLTYGIARLVRIGVVKSVVA